MPGIRKGLVVGWLIQKELKVEIENWRILTLKDMFSFSFSVFFSDG